MVSQIHETAVNVTDRMIRAADYIVDLLTTHDPVQMTLQANTYRVTAAEGTLFDKLYDITNKGRSRE